MKYVVDSGQGSPKVSVVVEADMVQFNGPWAVFWNMTGDGSVSDEQSLVKAMLLPAGTIVKEEAT